jgi:hypothetical protein
MYATLILEALDGDSTSKDIRSSMGSRQQGPVPQSLPKRTKNAQSQAFQSSPELSIQFAQPSFFVAYHGADKETANIFSRKRIARLKLDTGQKEILTDAIVLDRRENGEGQLLAC